MKGLWLGLLLLGACVTGCQTVPSLLVPVKAPPARDFPPPPPAMIRIPVVVSLPVDTLGMNPIPKMFTGDLRKDIPHWVDAAGGLAYQLASDPLHWEVSKNTLSTVMRLRYRLSQDALGLAVKNRDRVRDLIPSLTAGKEAAIRLQTVLQWNRAWHLETVTSLLHLPAFSAEMAGMPQKIDGLIHQAGEDYLNKQTAQFDERLRILTDLQGRATEVWSNIQEPIFLDKRIWLVIQPETVSVGQVYLDPLHPQTLETAFEMTARPQILFGDKPGVEKRPLPPLIPYRKGPSGFHALSNVKISYPEATRLLSDPRLGILGQVIRGSGDRKLRVKSLRFYGSGGKVVAEAKLEYNPLLVNLAGKPAKMTIYLVGTPRYLPQKRLFDLPDLDFDVKTSDFLVQVAEWIFKSDMRRMLRQKAKVPIGPKLDQLSAKLSTLLNRSLGPHAALSVQGVSLKVLDSFADNEGMKARVALDGNTQLKVDWK